MANEKRYLSFVDLAPFDRAWKQLGLDDDDHAALEEQILAAPTRHPIIRGTEGLRKIRFSPRSWNTGKSGAIRVLYVIFAVHGTILLVTAYPKNEKSTLTAAETRTINDLIRRAGSALGTLKSED